MRLVPHALGSLLENFVCGRGLLLLLLTCPIVQSLAAELVLAMMLLTGSAG